LPLGADTDLASEVTRRGEGRRLRAKMGFAEDEIVIFTGGKLVPAKRTELLFDAVAQLPDLRLQIVVAGDASGADTGYKQKLLELARGRRNIHFVGWLNREETYCHLDMSDLAVFPASQSILWQQAIAAGLGLIVGDVGNQDISYLNLEDNIVVLQGEAISADGFAASIREAIQLPGRLRQMGAGAIRVADAHLNWNRLIGRTLRYNNPVARPL
jgi:1,2-diacylglycerol 3-alpha-glucosyltransferase